jgi:hypothetical protein
MDVKIPAIGRDGEPRERVLESVIATAEWDGLVTPPCLHFTFLGRCHLRGLVIGGGG